MSKPEKAQDRHNNLMSFLTAVLAIGLLGLFWWVVVAAVSGANDPPRVADPVPTPVGTSPAAEEDALSPTTPAADEDPAPSQTPTTETTSGTATATPSEAADTSTTAPTTSAAAEAPQARGAYDPHARLLAIAAIVIPLLTTVVGFFFGQRVGEAGKAQIALAANEQLQQIEQRVEANNPSLVADLRRDKLLTFRRR